MTEHHIKKQDFYHLLKNGKIWLVEPALLCRDCHGLASSTASAGQAGWSGAQHPWAKYCPAVNMVLPPFTQPPVAWHPGHYHLGPFSVLWAHGQELDSLDSDPEP